MIKAILKKLRRVTDEEKSLKRLAGAGLEKTDIAIDCGANVGKITDVMAQSGATVYAFEPNPYAFSKLEKRFAEMKHVHCINKGVMDHDDVMKLYLHENAGENQVYWSTGSSLLSFKGNVDEGSYVDIEVIDLCDFIAKLDRNIKVLKLDVEGVECEILTKMIETGLTERIAHIFVETHDEKIPELKEKTDNLRELIDKKRLKNIYLDWV